MTQYSRHAAKLVAIGLLATVVTQILYMASLGGPQPADPAVGVTNADAARYFTERWAEIAAVWTSEVVAFIAIAIGALIALAHRPEATIAWAALLLSAIFNILQAGIGLSMFAPAATAGETLAPVATTIVAGAFFFYFLAKLLIGIAGIAIGMRLLGGAGAGRKAAAILALLSGAAAAALNLAALPQGMALVLPAGAAGSIAALCVGIAFLVYAQDRESAA